MQSVGWWLLATASSSGTVPRAPLASGCKGEVKQELVAPQRCLSVPLPLPSAERGKSPGNYSWGREGSRGPPGFVTPDEGAVAQPQS